MKMIEPSLEIWGEVPRNYIEALKWIEKGGRICYKSENKITNSSAYKFVNNVWKRGHNSVLEMSNIVVVEKNKSKNPTESLKKAKEIFDSKYFDFCIHKEKVHIGGSWRAWFEFLNGTIRSSVKDMFLEAYHIEDILKGYTFLPYDEDCPFELKRISVLFKIDRSISHELVRHRPASFLQLSQRYVRHDSEFVVTRPHWFNKVNEDEQRRYIQVIEYIEKHYKNFLKNGLRPEEARYILPNSMYTEVLVTTNISHWNFIINLRSGTGVYPPFRKLMFDLKEKFEKKGWLL